MQFNFASLKMQAAAPKIGPLFAVITGPRGSGKSGCVSSFPGEILYIYGRDEDHGVRSAMANARFHKGKITPLCMDVDNGIMLMGDQVLARLHAIIDALLQEQTPSFKCIAVDSIASLEIHVRKCREFTTANQYQSNEVNANKLLEIINKLKVLAAQKGIHVVMTCPATGTRDANGVFSQLTPVLTGFGATDKVFGAFADILVVGPVQVTDAETQAVHTQFCFQFSGDFTKSGKTFTGIPRTINFRTRVSGLMQQELPPILNASLEELLVYRHEAFKKQQVQQAPAQQQAQ